MAKPLTLVCFLIVMVFQWLLPAQMIVKHEEVLSKGKLYKFVAAPYDPEDPFKGRYVSLNFAAISSKRKGDSTFEAQLNSARMAGKKVYASFSTNAEGVSVVEKISITKPANSDFLLINAPWVDKYKDSSNYTFDFPFNEYFMEESKAPLAEQLYRDRLMDSANRSYAAVRIWKGTAVIENVFINDSTLHQIILNSTNRRP